jgi:hypothetical protein
VWVVELMAFQCSKFRDVDEHTYPIISCYRDFSLERMKHIHIQVSSCLSQFRWSFVASSSSLTSSWGVIICHLRLGWKCRPWKNKVMCCCVCHWKRPHKENDGKEEEAKFIWIDSDLSLIECTICFMLFKAEILIVQCWSLLSHSSHLVCFCHWAM